MPLQACIPDTIPSTGISLLRCPYFCALRAISSPPVELERRGHWRRRTSQTRQLVTVDFLPDSLSTYLCRTRSRATIVDSSHDNHSFLRWEQSRTEKNPGRKTKFRNNLETLRIVLTFISALWVPSHKRLQRRLVALLTSAERGMLQRKNKSGAQQNNRPS